jgi:putative oxidoreductase
MLRKLIQTREDHLLTLLRICLGVIFFAHGAQKVLGWFGGQGFSASMGFFTHGLGIPTIFAVLAVAAEFLGGVGLLFGLLTRVAALGITVVMAVAIFLVHAQNGLFMNWAGNQRGEGFEFHLMAIAIALTLVARGAGAWSLDRLVEKGLAGAHTIGSQYRHPLPHHG